MAGNTGKILVTGATGFIGCEVARQLSQKSYKPRLMIRRPLRGFLLKSLDVELMQGDLGQPTSLKRILEGIDTVIHLGARAALETARSVRPSIVEGSINLMRAAIDALLPTAGQNSRQKLSWQKWRRRPISALPRFACPTPTG
jgi:dihydroflavonol-4-reductase